MSEDENERHNENSIANGKSETLLFVPAILNSKLDACGDTSRVKSSFNPVSAEQSNDHGALCDQNSKDLSKVSDD